MDGRAFVIEDLDPESPMYGCMVFGTQGVQISKQRTADGRAWDWTTAMTASGIVADAIVAGLLTDKTGKNYWDLDTGKLKITKGDINIEGVAANTFPIILKGTDGNTIKIGPYWVGMENSENGTYTEMRSGMIEAGTFEGNSYTPKGYLMYDGAVKSAYAYETTTSDAANTVVSGIGIFKRSTSSSERYKTDITANISEELNPKKLYALPVKMFKYKDDYLPKDDAKYGKDVIGFIVEELEKCYPTAVQYIKGKPEMWNVNILIPAMMKLIQDLNERITRMEEKNGN